MVDHLNDCRSIMLLGTPRHTTVIRQGAKCILRLLRVLRGIEAHRQGVTVVHLPALEDRRWV